MLFSSQTLSHMDTPTILNLVVIYLLAYEDGKTESSKMSAYKIQMPGNYPEEGIQHTMNLIATDLVILIRNDTCWLYMTLHATDS
jgi:hypothetical protein